jgi:DNA-binding NarL/FixJ family response regulator
MVQRQCIVRDIIRIRLQLHGYTVLPAARTHESSRICQYHHRLVHLLLTDVVMPGSILSDLERHVVALFPRVEVVFMRG